MVTQLLSQFDYILISPFLILAEKQMARQERMLQFDSVAAACISAGRLDCITILPTTTMKTQLSQTSQGTNQKVQHLITENESCLTLQEKKDFLTQLHLTYVPPKYQRGNCNL